MAAHSDVNPTDLTKAAETTQPQMRAPQRLAGGQPWGRAFSILSHHVGEAL